MHAWGRGPGARGTRRSPGPESRASSRRPRKEMDEHMLLEGVLRGVLGGRGKRSRKALRYLTGRRGGSFVTPNTLLTAAGVAWGIFETLQNQQAAQGSPVPAGTTGPTGASTSPAAPVPPLPDVGGAVVPVDALRMIRL